MKLVTVMMTLISTVLFTNVVLAAQGDIQSVLPRSPKEHPVVLPSDVTLGHVYEHDSSLAGTFGTKTPIKLDGHFFTIALTNAFSLPGESVSKRSMNDLWQRNGETPPPTKDQVVGDLRLPWWPVVPGTQLKAWRFGYGPEDKKMFKLAAADKGLVWQEMDVTAESREILITQTYGGWYGEMGWAYSEEMGRWNVLPRYSSNPVVDPWKVYTQTARPGIIYEMFFPQYDDFQYVIAVGEGKAMTDWRIAPGTVVPRNFFESAPAGDKTTIRLDAERDSWTWSIGTAAPSYRLVNADSLAVYQYQDNKWELHAAPTVDTNPQPVRHSNPRTPTTSSGGYVRDIDFGPPTGVGGGSIWGGHSPLSDYIFYQQHRSEYPFGGPPTGMSFRDYIEWKNYRNGGGR